ncbi:homoserine kinase [Acinetobacter puyangensis]|uniref:homoserine kinase n=1 Tax=Acinetobacter puyangensis TaxID=1096779 RepID=UPI003A4D3A6A
MSVYTQLSLEQVQHFAKDFGLDIVEIQPIQGGIENTNYFLTAQHNKQYVLTVFEELDKAAASELIPALQHLGQQHLPVAVPLQYDGEAIHFIADKPAQIAPRLAGGHPIPSTVAQVAAIGQALANMHLALQNFPLERENNHGQVWWQKTATTLYQRMSADDQQLLDRIFRQFETAQTQFPDRPKGLIHADLFRDNTLYVGDQLTGILDFSELNRDELLLDISITLNDFCSNFPDVSLDNDKAQAFMTAYQQIRPLSTDEKACLNIYLAMAACRFWLSRLQVAERNQAEGRTGSDILQKDPQEMRLMLINRLTQEYNI